MQNIAAYLPQCAVERPHASAVIFPFGRDSAGRVAYTHLTFAQLNSESERYAAGLMAYGVEKGDRIVLMVKPSLAFFALTFAIFKCGAVPVFVDPGMGLASLKKCLTEAEPSVFVGIPKAHVARLVLRWPKCRLLVTVGRKGPWGGITLDRLGLLGESSSVDKLPVTSREDVAAILFTSGSTGFPKGVIYRHATFLAQVALLKQTYAIAPGEIDLCTFPLFALFAPALGMTAVIPAMDFTRPAKVDPENIRTPIEDFGCTNMFGSPALLNRVGRYGERHGWSFPTLKRVISAGAPVQPAVLKRFSLLVSDSCQVFTPYGATESLPVCSIGSHEILNETALATTMGKGVCVGQPVETMDVAIIPISDDALPQWDESLVVPQGTVGEIVVKGPVVTHAYFNRDASTQHAKMRDKDGSIRHRMGDVGYLDERGRVWFCGRKNHRVITREQTLFSVPCEGVFNGHPKVFRSALVGISVGNEMRPVICIELEPTAKGDARQTLIRELASLAAVHDHTQLVKHLLFHEGFPVDIRHNAKIFREKLAVWAQSQPLLPLE